MAAVLPTAALALNDAEMEEYYQKEKEKAMKEFVTQEEAEENTLKMIAGISAIVLISPIVGIQMARKAISDVKDDDDDRFSARDPRTKW